MGCTTIYTLGNKKITLTDDRAEIETRVNLLEILNERRNDGFISPFVFRIKKLTKLSDDGYYVEGLENRDVRFHNPVEKDWVANFAYDGILSEISITLTNGKSGEQLKPFGFKDLKLDDDGILHVTFTLNRNDLNEDLEPRVARPRKKSGVER